MMWDFGGGRRREDEPSGQYPPPMQMPTSGYQMVHQGPGPMVGGFVVPSSYQSDPMSGFIPPTYILPQYERTMYYGSNPPPPMQPFPSSPGSYAPMYNYPPPQFEGGERPRANSHSHSHAHHSHSHHSHSHHSRAHSHSHSHGPPPPVVITVPPPPVKLQKIPTPTKHTFEKPLPQAPQTLNQVHQSHSLGAIPHFQYSKCTGRKKALCIGINYLKQPHELRGCINDARHVRDFLIKTWGYRAGDIVLLSDDSPNPRELPTRQNIIDAMRWLVRGAKTHDSLVFHYSGHGGQTKDLNGDEIDGYDEVIFPVDFKTTGHIIDDEMHELMVKPLPVGCRLTALFDCCHSGTALDLPYIYSSHGRLKGSQVADRWRRQMATPADVISWSGCQDGQTSADTFAGGVPVGAMSYAFILSLTRNPKQTYQELLRSVRLILNPRFSQKPQLGSSHPIDTNLQFVM